MTGTGLVDAGRHLVAMPRRCSFSRARTGKATELDNWEHGCRGYRVLATGCRDGVLWVQPDTSSGAPEDPFFTHTPFWFNRMSLQQFSGYLQKRGWDAGRGFGPVPCF